MANAINWFEIPVNDIDRACKFYGDILASKIEKMAFGDYYMAFFPSQQEGVGGALVKGAGYTPSQEGTLAYLNGGDDLNTVLNRVESAGGKVVIPKTMINDQYGFYARFNDTEGNLVALHSMK